jgi:hypothetical protein
MSDVDKWSRLQNLKNLLEEGFISQLEYDERRQQLVDELTGTSVVSSVSSTSTSVTRTVTRKQRRSSSTPSDPGFAPPNSQPGDPVGDASGDEPPDSSVPPSSGYRPPIILPMINPRPPPTFLGIPTEKANKYTYDIDVGKWVKSEAQVKIDPVPFARGGIRFVYHLKELSADATTSYVAKMSFDPRDNLDRSVYFKGALSAFLDAVCHFSVYLCAL